MYVRGGGYMYTRQTVHLYTVQNTCGTPAANDNDGVVEDDAETLYRWGGGRRARRRRSFLDNPSSSFSSSSLM
jgi:hypothetical protein